MARLGGIFDAHEILQRSGLQQARAAAASSLQRICIDAAAAVARTPAGESRTMHGTIAVSYIPHRNPGEKAVWAAASGDIRTELMPGLCGYPFGSKARIVLLDLVDRAVRAGTGSIILGDTMRSWMQAMQVPLGGKTYDHIGEQARRIAGCKLRITLPEHSPADLRAIAARVTGFVSAFELEQADGQTVRLGMEEVMALGVFPAGVLLDQGFLDYAVATQVQLDRVAVEQISDNGWAIDLYIWLAGLLPTLNEPQSVSWSDFLAGFGRRSTTRRIKAKTLATLPLVAAVYPQARLSADQHGLILSPSPGPCQPGPAI